MISQQGSDERYRNAMWPEVYPRDWCGEFSPMLEEPENGWMV
jgi:hypothetical protein